MQNPIDTSATNLRKQALDLRERALVREDDEEWLREQAEILEAVAAEKDEADRPSYVVTCEIETRDGGPLEFRPLERHLDAIDVKLRAMRPGRHLIAGASLGRVRGSLKSALALVAQITGVDEEE